MIATATLAKYTELHSMRQEAQDALVLMRSAKAGITYDTAKRNRQHLVEAIADVVWGMTEDELAGYAEWRKTA
jgi:hypothetical protein